MNPNLLKLKAILAICFLLGAATFLQAQTVTVDNYFNNETHKDKAGNEVKFHYLWNDKASTGYSIFGKAFTNNGAAVLKTLPEKPTCKNLKGTNIYIIADPDNVGDNPHPNFMDKAAAKAISKWVKKGGVLFLLANDQKNCDLSHFNILAHKFGLNFNNDLILHVIDDNHFADGGISTSGIPMFKTAKEIFIKDACSITIHKKAKAILKDKNGANVLVCTHYGRGTVLAVGDPWLYNEYTNGRLPSIYENDKAANDVAAWLLSKTKQ